MKNIFSVRISSIILGSLLFVWWTFFWDIQDNRAQENLSYPKQLYHKDTSQIYFDLARSAQERKDYSGALKAYHAVLEHCPNSLEAYDNIGIIQECTNNKSQALQTYFKAMHIHPHFNQVRFMHGKKLPEHTPAHTEILSHKPQWTGQPLTNKTIFIYAENGFGDTINFARFLPALVERGATVLFKPQPTLATLFKQAPLNVTVLGKDDNLENHGIDYHCSLLSLPHLLNTTVKTIPTSQGYLKANADMKELFKNKLFITNKLKVGIVWQGNPELLNDANRSTKLPYFYDIARIPGVQLYSIQKFFDLEALKQIPSDITIVDLDPYIKTFADTAALVANLDLVIAIDSVVAHLAGALGTPVLMLTPYVTDWRWLGYSEGEKNVWYNSMKKFHQDATCTWKPVFARAAAHIKKLVQHT